MDIGTKDEPGRELDPQAAREIGGGQMLPESGDGPSDPLGESGGVPIDYSAVSGGEDAPTVPDTSSNPIWRVLEDWLGGSQG